MIQCTLENCGKAWNEPYGELPLCIEYDCPLREIRRTQYPEASRSGFLRTTRSTETMQGAAIMSASIQQSLNGLREDCDTEFKTYNMQGAQSATTIVTMKDTTTRTFTTTNQQHSEMVAIEWMLDNGYWSVYLGVIVWSDDFSSVTAAQFQTSQPHCGFCTIMLLAAQLPLSTPTCGNHKLASRLSYQIPVQLEVSPHFIARVLDRGCYCGFPALKRLLNVFVKAPANEWLLSIYHGACCDDYTYTARDNSKVIIEWEDLVEMSKREVIYLSWKIIFENIMLTNKEGK